MKSAQINEYGDSSVIQIKEVEKPILKPGQVLVEVYASSINPFDSAIRGGYMKEMIPLQFPVTLGGDISGLVIEIGKDVKDVAIGDKVYGQAHVVAGNSGAFAEYSATKASQIAKAPGNTNFNESASLPLVGVSALQALTEHIQLKKGQKIFIHGGAGGIGTVAIQIAKNIGAYVATTATGEGIDYVKGLSADEVVDYKTQDFSEVLSDYNAVFDAVGGDDFNKSFKIIKRGGIAVTMIAEPDEESAKKHGITAIRQATHVSTDRLSALAKLVEDGVVTPHVDKVFSLEDIQKAFELRESGVVKGKVVIQVKKA